MSMPCSLQPSTINTLIDTFFEMKKCEMRTQIDNMLDRMNTQVKELLLPFSISAAAAPAQSTLPKNFDLVGRKSMVAQELIAGLKPSSNMIYATKSFPPNIGADVQIKIDIENRKKKFICDHANCSKSFPSGHSLNRHRRSHLAIKPFRCEWPGCSYASANKSDTVRHMRGIHSKDPKQAQINGDQLAGDQNNSIRRDDDALSTASSSSFSVQPAKQNDNYADDHHDNDNEETMQNIEETEIEVITIY